MMLPKPKKTDTPLPSGSSVPLPNGTLRWESRIQGIFVREKIAGQKYKEILSLSRTDLVMDVMAYGETEAHERRMEAVQEPPGERRDTLDSLALQIQETTRYNDSLVLSHPQLATRQNMGIHEVSQANLNEWLDSLVKGPTSRSLDYNKPPDFILWAVPSEGIFQLELSKSLLHLANFTAPFFTCYETPVKVLEQHFGAIMRSTASQFQLVLPEYHVKGMREVSKSSPAVGIEDGALAQAQN